MATSLLVRNANGDRVVDFEHTYYLKSEGTTKLYNDLQAESAALADANGRPNSFGHRRPLAAGGVALNQVASPAGTYALVPTDGSITLTHPAPVMGYGDQVFYQLGPSGIWRSININLSLPEYPGGSIGLVWTDHGGPLPYRIASPIAPPFVPTTAYSLQLWRKGVKLFDSRYPQIAVIAHFVVSKAQISSILTTGDPLVLPLPKAAPNCWLSIPAHAAMLSMSGGTGTVQIHQTDPSTLTLSRRGTPSGSLRQSFTQDVVIIVAR